MKYSYNRCPAEFAYSADVAIVESAGQTVRVASWPLNKPSSQAGCKHTSAAPPQQLPSWGVAQSDMVDRITQSTIHTLPFVCDNKYLTHVTKLPHLSISKKSIWIEKNFQCQIASLFQNVTFMSGIN